MARTRSLPALTRCWSTWPCRPSWRPARPARALLGGERGRGVWAPGGRGRLVSLPEGRLHLTSEPGEAGDAPETVTGALQEVLRSRVIVLLTVIVDSILVAALVGVFWLLHYVIGDISESSLADKIVIIALQSIGAVGTVGLMLAYLIRDLIVAARRVWRSR